MDANDPVLYILMRNDLDSMNPGKAMAQAAHAANEFTAQKTIRMFDQDMNDHIRRPYMHSIIHPGLHSEERFRCKTNEFAEAFEDLYDDWAVCPPAEGRCSSFGTTIVLEGTIDAIQCAVTDVRRNFLNVVNDPEQFLTVNSSLEDLPLIDAQIIVDPTYPIRDGQVTHLIELPTCAYMFGRYGDLQHYVGLWPLHR